MNNTDYPDFKIRITKIKEICVISLLIIVISFSSGFTDEEPEKLSIPFKSIPLKDRDKIQEVIKKENIFLKWRGEEIEASTTIFNYLLERPVFTSTILNELGIAGYQIEKDDGLFKYDDGHGLTGDLKVIYKKDREKIYQGNYIYTTGVGVPVRLSGEWVLVLKYEEQNELLKIDIDLYLTQGDEGVGRITSDLPFILKSIMAEKVNSYIESVREISGMIHSDPQDVYERLKEGGEIKDRDLKEFKKIILSKIR